jgi:hypothetical protein
MGKASRRKRDKQQEAMQLSQEDVAEVLRLVRDDLAFLRSLNYSRPSRTEIRVASSILRRLLHEGMYLGAWRLAGLESDPSVSAVDLQAVVSGVEPRYIHYAYAGGAKTEGAHHKGHVLLVIPRAEVQADGQDVVLRRVQQHIKPGVTRTFSLQQFCASPAVISGASAVSRIDVVRYVANKLGGVHWDNRRGGWTDAASSRHRLLDEQHLVVGRLPAALYEVISIAQCIARSDDASRYTERVEQIAPEEERAANVLSFREGRIGKYADITFNADQREKVTESAEQALAADAPNPSRG